MNTMKKRITVLALLLAMALLLAACGGQDNKVTATDAPAPTATPAPTEPPKTEEELILERDTAAIKLAVEMTKTMMATAGEKEAAEGEDSKVARFYKRISQINIDNPYRAIILTPTDEQVQKVKALTHVDEEYRIAPSLAKLVNIMVGGNDYGTAAEAVSAEADASAVGENVLVLLPCQDIVVVSIFDGKATGSLFWGTDEDYLPEQITATTERLGITDLTYRNYDRDALKTMLGE